LGLYISCRKGDASNGHQILRIRQNKNRLLIIIFQESHTWINFDKRIFVLNHKIGNCKKYLKQQSNQYNHTKDIKKLQIYFNQCHQRPSQIG
jgi:hypothetical protein